MLLPQPLGPTSATNSPGLTSRSIGLKISIGCPLCPRTTLVTADAWITALSAAPVARGAGEGVTVGEGIDIAMLLRSRLPPEI